jgi:hypothetical protein
MILTKTKKITRDDGELAHLKKDNKCNQENDMFIVTHFI